MSPTKTRSPNKNKITEVLLITDYERLNDNFLDINLFKIDTIKKYLNEKAWCAVQALVEEKKRHSI